MGVGDLYAVEGCEGVHYVDTGMYETAEYGAVYILTGEKPAVVDTGIGTHVDRVFDALEKLDIARESLRAILPTHVHLDHAGGAGYLAEACPNADVYVHERGARHLVDPERLVEGTRRAVGDQWRYYVEPKPIPQTRVVELSDGDTISLGSRTLEVHHAPGHAPHQVVFLDRLTDALFTADAAGIWVPSLREVRETSPPPNFDLEQCVRDVEMLQRLEPEHLLYPHFGPAPQRALDDYPTVLRSWVETVQEAVEDHGTVVEAARALALEDEVAAVWGSDKARGEVAMNVRGVAHSLGLD
jgi:glyoxylase-like metal-dependent hydrolase (beta-lactamase superfamily II)